MDMVYFIAKMSGPTMVRPASSDFWKAPIDFLKVLSFSFPVPVVGPSAKDFYHLQRAKFTG